MRTNEGKPLKPNDEMRKARVIKQYNLYDIPNTMLKTFEAILKKHPNKPIIIVVWENEVESDIEL